jgi:hypothetical protein
MVNMIRNIKRLNLCALIAAFAALGAMSGAAQAQSSGSPYTARGIAPVTEGNISAARAAAVSDAQKKIVLAALADQMPMETLHGYFETLYSLFLSRPDVYVQRFKIISETTLSSMHQVLIEAFSEDELLRRDLESIGVHGQSRQVLHVFLVVDQAGSLDAAEQMAFSLRERGAVVVEDTASPAAAGGMVPDSDVVVSAARDAGAGVAVLAKVFLKQAETRPGSSFAQVQCDASADVFDVRMRTLVVQASTTALGVHIDHEAAVRDALAKASSRLVEQILDRLHVVGTATHAYTFRFRFSSDLSDLHVREFFTLLRAALPEVVHFEVRDSDEERIKIIDVVSSVESASLVQKVLNSDLAGYRLSSGMVEDSVINMTVTPPVRQ